MTDIERALIAALADVIPAMADRRYKFAVSMKTLMMRDDQWRMTPRQQFYLAVLCWQFRETMPEELFFRIAAYHAIYGQARIPRKKKYRQIVPRFAACRVRFWGQPSVSDMKDLRAGRDTPLNDSDYRQLKFYFSTGVKVKNELRGPWR